MGEPQPFRLILASSSPARRELLQDAGVAFEIKPANIDEPQTGFHDARTMVQTISWLKAAAVALGHGLPTMPQQDCLILAADTIGWINDHPILKPTDEADARRILRELGGREHELWTGVTIWRRPDNLQIAWQERSVVHFKGLSDAELDVYLAKRQWKNHSGAYAILERGDPYVSVVEGSVSNVIGLPMETLTRVLEWLHKQ
jgi:septum formation protein